MSRLTRDLRSDLPDLPDDGWKERLGLAERDRSNTRRMVWLVAGVAAVGLGIWAMSYLGPDMRRYMKIRSM